jgi:hypothetical protein
LAGICKHMNEATRGTEEEVNDPDRKYPEESVK